MYRIAPFSAKNWIIENMMLPEQLSPETLNAVESFTLMWQVFEGLVCDNSATISRLEKLAAEIVERRRCQAEITSIFAEFQNWFCPEGDFTPYFDNLRLRASDRREFIQSVLCRAQASYESRVLALLFILYRLNRTVLSGPRSLELLEGLTPVLNAACLGIATVIEAHGRYFKRKRYGE